MNVVAACVLQLEGGGGRVALLMLFFCNQRSNAASHLYTGRERERAAAAAATMLLPVFVWVREWEKRLFYSGVQE